MENQKKLRASGKIGKDNKKFYLLIREKWVI